MWTVNNESKLATKYGQVSFGQRLTMPFGLSSDSLKLELYPSFYLLKSTGAERVDMTKIFF